MIQTSRIPLSCQSFMLSGKIIGVTLLLLAASAVRVEGFQASRPSTSFRASPIFSFMATRENEESTEKKEKKKRKSRGVTLKEFTNQVLANPAKYLPEGGTKGSPNNQRKKSKYRRTRQRVDNPKQTYLYATQRRALEQQQKLESGSTVEAAETDEGDDENATPSSTRQSMADLVQELNLAPPSTMHCEPFLDSEPKLLGRIRISEDETDESSNAYAYLIEKPAGWAILGSKASTSSSKTPEASKQEDESTSTEMAEKKTKTAKESKSLQKRVKVTDDDGSMDILEYSEQDVFSLFTAEELELFLEEGGELPEGVFLEGAKKKKYADFQMENPVPFSNIPSEVDLETEHNPTRLENLRRIQARAKEANKSNKAFFAISPRPSVVNWLKELQANQFGKTLRGGNFWKAIAGATNVDDSGIVLLCPKKSTDKLFVDSIQYMAVVGNGGHVTPSSALPRLSNVEAAIDMQEMAKLKKARGDDVVETVKITIPEQLSTCDHVVRICQEEYLDGIRGDPIAHPLERFASRRLLHCNAMAVSSLVQDDYSNKQVESLPDDIALVCDRRNNLAFRKGSFLGRQELRDSQLTTAYREINGAADGFPGWTVDRYDKWLFVQHDPDYPKGPIPSIHDGFTSGVYYLEARQDRSSMGSSSPTGNGLESTPGSNNRPRLLEGQHAPDTFAVVENGVKYMVSLDRDLSTGIFLDQRPQRAWVAKNCGPDTRVLNCFAHTGAFSVAAATAGASTVSVDLSKKWLDRLPQHLEANGIDFDERHDAIYGDCFDWLARLAKRGEKYDIVILDPPSASVGGRKKKRWSVKNDMDELVALAAQLVKKNGLLWTTTNNAGISSVKFARLCHKGLESRNAKLERIAPMPTDFSTVGPHNVKNLVWRLP